jgi:adenylate cyclase
LPADATQGLRVLRQAIVILRGAAMIKKYADAANRFIEENKFSGIIVALIFFLLVALFCFTRVYELFELKLYDLRFTLHPSVQESDRLYFVDIDENSLTTVGQYPWPRNIYSKGLKTLKEIVASQVTFDIMFPDASPLNVDDEELAKLGRKARSGDRIKPDEIEAIGVNKDRIFADGVASMGRVILSYTFNDEPLAYDVIERQKKEIFKKALPRFMEKSSVKVSPDQMKKLASLESGSIQSLSYPIPELMNAAHAFGFVNRDTDIDGTTRKVRLVRLYQGRLYFNLALVMLMDLCRVPMANVDVAPGKRIVLKNAINPATEKIEDIAIPIDKQGMMYVMWAGSGEGKEGRREKTFRQIPFYALLEYPDKKKIVKDIFEQEDKMKSEQTANLNDQLESLTDPASIAEVKKKIDLLRKNPLLEEVTGRIESARIAHAKAVSASDKKKRWDLINDLKKKANSTKLEYLGNYENEISKVKKELAQKNTEEFRQELKKLQYVAQAMDLAIRVEDMADRSILVGLTATGSQDIGAIPIHNEYARVGTYHNTVNTIIQKQHITRVGWPVNLILMLLIAAGMGFAIQRLDAKRSLIFMLVTFIVLNLAVMALFAFFNVWLQQLGIVLSMFLPSLAIVAIKFVKEESQKRFIKGAFSYYLSPSVIDTIINDPGSLKLGGEDREITIFFSDVKAFSTISEKLTPQELVNRMNEYLTEMTDIILKYDGTVDKFIGDAIMAFYGAPIAMPDHPLKACMAAIDMKKRLRELQEMWRKAGMDEIHARMGIHSGKATVGNMGSRNKMNYTVMGDAVNLASRLEGANKHYETSAMISGATYEGAKDRIEARRLDVVRVVGKTEAVPIYELMGMKGSLPDRVYGMLEAYNKGLESFAGRDWKQARAFFKQALKVLPDDRPSGLYVERCETFLKNPPSRGWDGVYVMKGK